LSDLSPDKAIDLIDEPPPLSYAIDSNPSNSTFLDRKSRIEIESNALEKEKDDKSKQD
jgi:ATP-dependent Clp protease ATP-binding subunit ClpA